MDKLPLAFGMAWRHSGLYNLAAVGFAVTSYYEMDNKIEDSYSYSVGSVQTTGESFNKIPWLFIFDPYHHTPFFFKILI